MPPNAAQESDTPVVTLQMHSLNTRVEKPDGG